MSELLFFVLYKIYYLYLFLTNGKISVVGNSKFKLLESQVASYLQLSWFSLVYERDDDDVYLCNIKNSKRLTCILS